MFDLGQNFLRTSLATVQGAATPYPYGGKIRQIQVDLDLPKLQSYNLSPIDIVNAVNAQNLILPTGTTKLGPLEYNVEMNGTPQTIAELNDLPVKTSNGATLYMRDVAHIRDGFAPQTNIVRQDGNRGALMSIYKNGKASTLQIVAGIKNIVPLAAQSLPPELKISALFDQSLFVRASIQGVLHEALLAAALTAVMILLFLGDWRPTIVIAISIPLSIFCSIITLAAIGETLNIMTLGGLALAVGILVDDATVEIENIERNLAMGKEMRQAILDGAQQIAVPAFVSTLCICIVFVPMFFLSGVARFLFVPLAEAVSFAMLASYLLSRTLIPTLVMYIMRGHEHRAAGPKTIMGRFQRGFERKFEDFRRGYQSLLETTLEHRGIFVAFFLLFCLLSLGLLTVPRAGLLPAGGCRPVAPACSRPSRSARGRDGAALRRGRSRAAPANSRQRDSDDSRQHRPAQLRHQPVLQLLGNRGQQRCGDSDFARSRTSPSHRGPHPAPARGAAAALPRRGVLLPAGRYRHPDFELRAAGPDRRSGDRS